MHKKSVSTKEFLTILRNLSVTLKAGVPLLRSLTLLEDPTSKKKKFVTELRASVEKGMTMAAAMDASHWKYPPIAVSLIRAGELSGTLEQNVETVVKHIRKSVELGRKIKGAMMYPSFVLIAIMGLGLSVGTFVLPQLLPLFESLDVQLPFTTRMLMAGGKFFSAYGLVFTPSVVLLGILGMFIIRMEAVKPILHRLTLRIPLIKTIQKNSAVAQISSTLGTLLKSGIPIAEAVPATAQATTNYVFRAGVLDALPLIQEGNTLAEGLKSRSDLFPPIMVTLIEIGETTGTLSETLAFIADYYEEEVDYAVKNLTTAIEPILLIFIGVVVATFVLSIITPLYDVTSSVA